MSGLGFAHDGGEAPPSEAESLLDAPGHRNLGAVAGDAEVLAENPNSPSTVIDLKHSVPQRSEGIGYATGNCNVLSGEAAWITINLSDVGMRGAARENENPNCQRHCQ
jgi:hypothetical protein